MAKRRIDMYEYHQIIVQFRMGVSIRGIAKAGLASRVKAKQIFVVATEQGWLDACNDMPSDDVLASFFHLAPSSPASQPSVLPYQKQIAEWHQQGVQGSVIHAVLQRQHGFKGSYHAVQRYIKKIKDQSP